MKQVGELKVADYMTQHAIVVNDSEKLTNAIKIMDDRRLSVLPVVDSQGAIAGILSVADLIEITHEIQADLGALSYVTEKTQDFLIKLLIESST